MRFSTLTALYDALDCQPSDLITIREQPPVSTAPEQ
ncbi:helix-turn-helix domain-containing protein [Actinoplanes awajinensis]